MHVLPTLQVFHHPRILAAGDIIDWDEQKQLSKYHTHADVVVRNVIDILKERQPGGLYKGRYERIVISNGKVSKCDVPELGYRALTGAFPLIESRNHLLQLLGPRASVWELGLVKNKVQSLEDEPSKETIGTLILDILIHITIPFLQVNSLVKQRNLSQRIAENKQGTREDSELMT